MGFYCERIDQSLARITANSAHGVVIELTCSTNKFFLGLSASLRWGIYTRLLGCRGREESYQARATNGMIALQLGNEHNWAPITLTFVPVNAERSSWGLMSMTRLVRQGQYEQVTSSSKLLYYIRVHVFAAEFQGATAARSRLDMTHTVTSSNL